MCDGIKGYRAQERDIFFDVPGVSRKSMYIVHFIFEVET